MNKTQRIISDFESDNIRVWVSAFLLDRRTRNASPGSIRFYRQKLEPFAEWCDCGVLELMPNHIRAFLVHLEDTGHNTGGRHAYYRAIRAFLNFFEEEVEPEGWKNPIKKVRPPKVRQVPLNPVSIQEVQSLVDACSADTFYDVRDRAIFLTLLETGVRASELLHIKLQDIDLMNGSIQINHAKGGKVRIVLIGRSVRKAIRKWLRKRPSSAGSLFTKKNGDSLGYDGLRAILERRAKEANIEGVSLHDFRRAFCLNQLQAGTPEITIARLMGHSNTQLIGLYAKQTTREIREVFHSVTDSNF